VMTLAEGIAVAAFIGASSGGNGMIRLSSN
jgi:hypothetical protein